MISSPIGEQYSGWRYTDPKIRGFGRYLSSRRRDVVEPGGQLQFGNTPVTR